MLVDVCVCPCVCIVHCGVLVVVVRCSLVSIVITAIDTIIISDGGFFYRLWLIMVLFVLLFRTMHFFSGGCN